MLLAGKSVATARASGRDVWVFITAVPIIKLFARGKGDCGGHVHETRRAEAYADYSAQFALGPEFASWSLLQGPADAACIKDSGLDSGPPPASACPSDLPRGPVSGERH